MSPKSRSLGGFTLIELLVVVGIIALLVSILSPVLGAARQRARAAKCLANLHVLGQGIVIYANENRDVLVGGRLPKFDSCNSVAEILGGLKFRPTFLAQLSPAVGAPPFADPMPCKNMVDRFGQKGDRQNYSYETYLCPSASDWRDERNGSYGYNYQFLGNTRTFDAQDQNDYRNWPVLLTRVTQPGATVAVADAMGTAANYPEGDRLPYSDDPDHGPPDDPHRLGNEGFNLDPPWVNPDELNGEMADIPEARSAADPRHANRANVLWVDGHVEPWTMLRLGYTYKPEGGVALDGDNSRWTPNGVNVPWTFDYEL